MRSHSAFRLTYLMFLPLALIFLLEHSAIADNYYVDASSCPGPGSGTIADPYCSIQDGIDRATAGDTVQVAGGTYVENIIMKSGVVIQGAGQGVTTIDGRNGLVVVTATSVDSNAKLDGFTITGGAGGDFLGGGMDNLNSSPMVSNCNFTGNTSKLGGGMRNQSSSPTVTGCTFFMNSASDNGAGMYNYSSTPTVTGCTFSMNSDSDNGTGMYNHSSSPTVTGCTFSENTATNGAGMYNYASSPTVNRCTFSQNYAVDYGGGMYNKDSSSPIVTNSLFSANEGEYGGGIYNLSSSPAVTNCIFSANEGYVDGGGMYNDNSSSRPDVTNCLFFNNIALSGRGLFNAGSPDTTVTNCIFWEFFTGAGMIAHSTIVTYSNIKMSGSEIYPGTGNINADPLFIDADGPDDTPGTSDDNFHLQAGSPCIDAGDNDAPVLPAFDYDGEDRKIDDPLVTDTGNGTAPIVDMGPYEYFDRCPADPNKIWPGECGCGEPDEDTDGDGTLDCNDDCPQDEFKTEPGDCGCGNPETDTDDDGTPDCIDEDDDGDGMPDLWEEFYGLDPLVDDADDDFDGDGHTNFEEYVGNTDPSDPQDHPPRFMPWLPILLE